MNIKSFHPIIRMRLFLLFISSVSSSSVMPYLIIYFSAQVGNVVTGFLFIGVLLANLLGSVVGGYVSDRIGRKKIILLSEFAVFLGFIGAAFANSFETSFPYYTFLFFIVIQFSVGANNPVYQALIIDVSLPEERKTIYTYSYWLRNAGIAIGSMIGAFLFTDYLFHLFIGVAITTLCSFLIISFFIHETYTPIQNEPHNQSAIPMLRAYRTILAHRFFTVFSIAGLLLVSVEEQLTNYIGVRLANTIDEPVPLISFLPYKVDGVNLLGILKAENTILVVCFTMIIAKAIQRLNERNALLIGLLLFVGGYTVISISTTPYILLIAMLLASVGEIMHVPVKQTILANIVPNHARSTYMALYQIAVILGVSTAGIFVIISSWLSPVILTTFIGTMGLVSIAIFYHLTTSESVKKQQLDLT